MTTELASGDIRLTELIRAGDTIIWSQGTSEPVTLIDALPSRTRDGTISRIVARLTDGVATAARADADLVVTEYGAAELRGKTIAERVRSMINIAHPDCRESLSRAAREQVAGMI